jgi:DNA-binding transcriptional MerR regulator
MRDPDSEDYQISLAVTDEDTRRTAKSEAAFRTISEVSADVNVPQHVLRFWESKFNQVRPLKRGGGRRYYRPEDVALLKRIRALLYDEGMTIRGVQKLLREPAAKPAAETASAAPSGPNRDAMRRLLAELTALRDDLRDALADR